MHLAGYQRCLTTGMVVGLILFSWGSCSEGAPLIGDSSSYGVSVNLSLDVDPGLVDILTSASLSPTPTVSGFAPAPYNNSDSLASASATGTVDILGLATVDVINFNTGVLDVQAQSDVTGANVSSTTSSQATVNGTSLDIRSVDLLGSASSFISLATTQIDATAQVNGLMGSLTPSGSATLTGTGGESGNQAILTVLGTQFFLDSNPAANSGFTIDSSLGGALASLQGSIDVFLNEQITSGNGSTQQGIDVNALRLSFNSVAVQLGSTTGILNGDVTISNAQADMAAVPEPASMLLLGGGLLGMMFSHRRQRLRAAAA